MVQRRIVTVHCAACINLGRYTVEGTETVRVGGRDYRMCREHARVLAGNEDPDLAAVLRRIRGLAAPTEHAT